MIRRFQLQRLEDETGISGTGIVAEGVQFSSGICVISWLNSEATGNYKNIETIRLIHGHNGKTEIKWIDDILLRTLHLE